MKDDFVSEEAKQATDLSWDKFMDDIVKRELDAAQHQKEYAEQHGNHPVRELNRRTTELPLNRTRYARKK